MAEYIDREVAIDAITDLAGKAPTRSAYDAIWKSARALRKIPAADVAPVIYGTWMNYGDGEIVTCSRCGYEAYAEAFYVREGTHCPMCGARMDGGAVDEP